MAPKKATKKAAKAKSPGYYQATCPVCSKTFLKGGFHPASQKLWQHMERWTICTLRLEKNYRGTTEAETLIPRPSWFPRRLPPRRLPPRRLPRRPPRPSPPRKRRALCAARSFLKAVATRRRKSCGSTWDIRTICTLRLEKRCGGTKEAGMVRGFLVEYLYNNSYGQTNRRPTV